MSIKQIFTSDNAICIADTDGKVWMKGNNMRHRLGVAGGTVVGKPICSSIRLGPDERITRFHAYERLVAIYVEGADTDPKRLFISRILNPKIKIDDDSDHEICHCGSDDSEEYDEREAAFVADLEASLPDYDTDTGADMGFVTPYTGVQHRPGASDSSSDDTDTDESTDTCTDSDSDVDSIDELDNDDLLDQPATPDSDSESSVGDITAVPSPSSIFKLFTLGDPKAEAQIQLAKVLVAGKSRELYLAYVARGELGLQELVCTLMAPEHNSWALEVQLEHNNRFMIRVMNLHKYAVAEDFNSSEIFDAIVTMLMEHKSTLGSRMTRVSFDPEHMAVIAPTLIDSSGRYATVPKPKPPKAKAGADSDLDSDLDSDFDSDLDSEFDLDAEEHNTFTVWPERLDHVPEACEDREFAWAKHNFGSDSHFDNVDLFEDIEHRLGAEFALEAGFTEIRVDEVTIVAETVFWRKDGHNHVYNWHLTPKTVMWNNMGLALRPVHHRRALTYYQINMPFDASSMVYRDNYLYVRDRTFHHIISAYQKYAYADNTNIVWYYFQFGDFDLNEIYMDPYAGHFYLRHEQTIYAYVHLAKDLKPIIRTDTPTYLSRGTLARPVLIYFVSKARNSLISFNQAVCISKPSSLLAHVQCIHQTVSKLHLVMISIDKTKRFMPRHTALFINTQGLTGWFVYRDGCVFVTDDGSIRICSTCGIESIALIKIKTIEVGQHAFNIYRFKALPKPLLDVQMQNQTLVIRAGALHYDFSLKACDSNIGLNEVTLTHTITAPDPISYNLVQRPSITNTASPLKIRIETSANRLERLVAISEMLDSTQGLAITYIHRGNSISYGDGIIRVFITDALSQFANTYLIRFNAVSEYDLGAFEHLSVTQIYALGRALHMAIRFTASCLPIRLPLALSIALAQREPTIPELEYFAAKEDLETFNTISSYKDDRTAMLDFGYDSYAECLRARVHYNHSEDDCNERVRCISQALAVGFVSVKPLDNARLMNLQTIDYYLSGAYVISRTLLLQRLVSETNSLRIFIKGIIEEIDEEQLASMLRNWAGSTVLHQGAYRIKHMDNSSDVIFQTCTSSILISKRLFSLALKNPEARELLVQTLVTPMHTVHD